MRLAPGFLFQLQGPFHLFSVSSRNLLHILLSFQTQHVQNIAHHLSTTDWPSPVSPVTKIYSTTFSVTQAWMFPMTMKLNSIYKLLTRCHIPLRHVFFLLF